MNKIIKKWLDKLKEFAKEPSYKQIRFPMKVDSMKGILYSPEGLLCELHSVDTKTKWTPEPEDGKLASYLFYFEKSLSCPDQVLNWAGISAAEMSKIRMKNSDGGFDAVIKYLEEKYGL